MDNICSCKPKYSIETYKDFDDKEYSELFYDRCVHKHGFKIAILKEVDHRFLIPIIEKLNK